MANEDETSPAVSQEEYEALAAFRFELRQFLSFSEAAARTLGMTPQQHQSLLAIRAAPERMLTIGELAEQLFIQPHTASELADRMVGLEWLARRADERDRRRVALALTPRAEALLGRMSATHRAEVRRIGSTLTDLLARITS